MVVAIACIKTWVVFVRIKSLPHCNQAPPSVHTLHTTDHEPLMPGLPFPQAAPSAFVPHLVPLADRVVADWAAGRLREGERVLLWEGGCQGGRVHVQCRPCWA